MSSLINPTNIDGTYPIPGQDNNSQGFRNNFTNIKNNFGIAKTEIDDLQAKSVLKAPLEGEIYNVNTFNDLNDYPLLGARFRNTREFVVDLGTGSTFEVDVSAGPFQFLTSDANVSLTFTGWPSQSARHAKVRVLMNIDATRTLTLSTVSTTWYNLDSIPGYLNSGSITLKAGLYLFEFSTYTGNSEIYVTELLRRPANNNVVEYAVGNISATPNQGTLSSTVSVLALYGLSTVAVANVALPANVELYDGQRVTISSNVAITQCNIAAGSGTTIRGTTSVATAWAAHSGNSWVFSKSLGAWFTA